MSRLPTTHLVRRTFSLSLAIALLTASIPMHATALRGAPAPAAEAPTSVDAPRRVVLEPRAAAAAAPGRVAEAPHDPSTDRQEAAGLRHVGRDAAEARAAAIAAARAEAAAKAKAEAAAKAAAEKAHKAAEAKAKAEAAAKVKAEAAAAAKAEAAAAKAHAAEIAKAKAEAAAAAKARTEAAATAAKAKAEAPAPKPAAKSNYQGRNHFWFPALGISASVAWFPCSRAEEPGNAVYRWGCGGSNNVYLMAHAWGHFNALNRAYYNGALKAGQTAVYADNDGRIHYYRLDFLRTGPPTAAQSWAWAAQPGPSMTLQTCIGTNSEGRLFVRFHEVSP
jgi:hypothetical protein